MYKRDTLMRQKELFYHSRISPAFIRKYDKTAQAIFTFVNSLNVYNETFSIVFRSIILFLGRCFRDTFFVLCTAILSLLSRILGLKKHLWGRITSKQIGQCLQAHEKKTVLPVKQIFKFGCSSYEKFSMLFICKFDFVISEILLFISLKF